MKIVELKNLSFNASDSEGIVIGSVSDGMEDTIGGTRLVENVGRRSKKNDNLRYNAVVRQCGTRSVRSC